MQRIILATTLAASYGIYGPAYELGENLPAKPGSEEYLHSEKYEIRRWDRSDPHSIAPLVTLLNQIRRTNSALQSDLSLHFHPVDNPQILCYSKSTLKPPPPLTLAETLSPVPPPAVRPRRVSLRIVAERATGGYYSWSREMYSISARILARTTPSST